MKQKQKMNVIIHQILLLWLSEYQVVAVFFQNSKRIVYKFASVPFCRICCSFFCQLCDVDCLFVIFDLLMSNIKFAVCSINSAAYQNSLATFWVYSVPDTICCLFKLLYTFVVTADLSDDIKHMFIKFIEKLYYFLKSLFILTALTKVLWKWF